MHLLETVGTDGPFTCALRMLTEPPSLWMGWRGDTIIAVSVSGRPAEEHPTTRQQAVPARRPACNA